MRALNRDLVELYGIPAPDYVCARVLAAGVAESVTVPTGARYAVFSSTGDFYARFTGTATVPVDTDDGTASELNPGIRDVSGLTTLSVISAGTPTVTVAFYV